MKRPMCVRHRTGWCATRQEDLNSDSIETVCGHYVVLPWGIERRHPNCKECKAILAKEALK